MQILNSSVVLDKGREVFEIAALLMVILADCTVLLALLSRRVCLKVRESGVSGITGNLRKNCQCATGSWQVTPLTDSPARFAHKPATGGRP